MADTENKVLDGLQEPALSECTRLLKAVSHIKEGRYAEATITLQAFVANWTYRHPDLPLVVHHDNGGRYDDRREPTDRQVEFAFTVAKFVQKKLPSRRTRGAYGKFLDDNVPEYRKIVAELRESGMPVVPKASDEDVIPEPEAKACCVERQTGSSLKDADKREVDVDKETQEFVDEIPF